MRGTTERQHCHPCTSLSGGDTMWYYYPRGPVCDSATAIASTERRPQVEGFQLLSWGLARTKSKGAPENRGACLFSELGVRASAPRL